MHFPVESVRWGAAFWGEEVTEQPDVWFVDLRMEVQGTSIEEYSGNAQAWVAGPRVCEIYPG